MPTNPSDQSSGVYLRNPDCWASNIDLTCVPVWNSQYQGPYTLGCLVAPRIVLVANHYAASEGSIFRFVSKTINPVTGTNDVYTAVIKKWIPLQTDFIDKDTVDHDFDLGFVVLDHALDPTIIKPAKILGSVDRLGVDDPYWKEGAIPWGVPCLGMNQQLEAFVQDAHYQSDFNKTQVRFAWVNAIPTNPQRLGMYREVVGGDSANPCFLIKDGKPVLVTLWTYSGSGVAIQHFVNLPNAAPNIINLSTKIAEYRAGSTGGIPNDDGIPENWQLQLENFDTYPSY